ncbi:hypothetical protein HIM_10153 [Hirsutella minnesotensis 3608]|uniref:Methyltransferase domain-containing protein n=1 Tax=Hirsutella minnesotensis 3608 TaxID=1043627 RepID=A0A0F7ZG85_9HYPO|nr:hypothetical protein HIM_10153 [Hirsutella minnesotensis 3608]
MPISDYTLNNGPKGVEESRLDTNHHELFKPMMAGALLPANIMTYLRSLEAPVVADVATGTGVWLEDLAAELPAASQLDGYDFDTSKFRSSQKLPTNVKLQFGNVLEPFPEAIHGKYDVVHARLLLFALKADQWDIAAANLKTLLKDGGWLLWEETSYMSWTCLPMSRAFYEWIGPEVRYASKIGRDICAPARLHKQIQDQGFTNCSQQIFSSFSMDDPKARRAAARTIVTVAYQSMNGILDRGGFESIQTREDANRLRDEMLRDIDIGHTFGLELWWICCQKPVRL